EASGEQSLPLRAELGSALAYLRRIPGVRIRVRDVRVSAPSGAPEIHRVTENLHFESSSAADQWNLQSRSPESSMEVGVSSLCGLRIRAAPRAGLRGDG